MNLVGTASTVKRALHCLRLGVLLVVGNPLIILVFLVTTSFNRPPLMIIGAPIYMGIFLLLYWVWAGMTAGKRGLPLPCLVFNLLMAEVWPLFIGLLLRQEYDADNAGLVIIGTLLNTAFAVVMPAVIGIAFVYGTKRSRLHNSTPPTG